MPKNRPIYLDYAATTPTDPQVVEAMLPWFSEHFGNAASRTHAYGWNAEKAVAQSREKIAGLINTRPEEIIFTSGATEAINLALKGLFETHRDQKDHIITVSTEHKAVLDTCQYLEKKGAQVTYLPVDQNGLIRLADLEASINDRTLLVCVMYGNNETGVIQPINEIADLAHTYGAYFMTDGTQAVGKVTIDASSIDLMSFSGHKLYGPKGIGALYVKNQYPRIAIAPAVHGGGHERGMRSGTLNVPSIVGFGEACMICKKEMINEAERLYQLRKELEAALMKLEGVCVNGVAAPRLPHISSLYFEGIDGEALVMAVRDELAIANGSACTSAEILPSHVLMAMFDDEDIAYSSVRISLGRFFDGNIGRIVSIFEKRIEQLKSTVL